MSPPGTIPAHHSGNTRKHPLRGPTGYKCHGKQILPRLDLVRAGRPVFLDVEGIELTDLSSVLMKGVGRVSVVNEKDEIVLDTFVSYPSDVSHRPGWYKSGVGWKDIRPDNFARPIGVVLHELKAIFDKAGTVVGHALENEQQYLRGLPWSHWHLRDTQRFSGFAQYAGNPEHPRPGLKVLALSVAGIKIQEKVHCSVQDARATRRIYSMHSDGIEKEQSEAVFQAKLLYTNFPREYNPATDPTAKYLVVADLTEQMASLGIEPPALSSSMPVGEANEGTDEIEAKL
ncbi:hypothetical protein CKM354_000250100 [Cercospora kikuchii]|uniref:Exonuclease domain-containing protein n=1 Tax=Cercospora kikuchii TaxID=84275 RepID=A0A9P3CEW2_9PEZI|nr:uncharacterized protein CKM354_000250100 [Cercospora kikuchii]GIZ39110.1 hypothetical protein CKM354_000250100 [Cercospora kikuchii]